MFKDVTITMTYLEWKQLSSYLDEVESFEYINDSEETDDVLSAKKFKNLLDNIEAE